MLMYIILYLLQLIQQLYQQNCFLINFICKYIPLKQWFQRSTYVQSLQHEVLPWRKPSYLTKTAMPHCMHTLVPKKDRKHFIVHKCVNPKCPYYVKNLKKVDKADLKEDYGKNKYKLLYIYREFTLGLIPI